MKVHSLINKIILKEQKKDTLKSMSKRSMIFSDFCPSNIRDLKHRQRNTRRRRLQPKEDWVKGFVFGGENES